MDLTEVDIEVKNRRAKKMMLWFGIISLIMSFAGWTSAFVVSSTRPDWLTDFQIPTAFVISTIVIVISSLTFLMAKLSNEAKDGIKNKKQRSFNRVKQCSKEQLNEKND